MAKLYGEAYRRVRVCVDSYDEGAMVGRYYHPGAGDAGFAFHSLTQLLLGVEDLLDEGNFPQSFTARRTFAPQAEKPPGCEAAGVPKNGTLATFEIRLMFRQHASWQGGVLWVEGKAEQSFRSALELILLMDSALGGCRSRAAPG